MKHIKLFFKTKIAIAFELQFPIKLKHHDNRFEQFCVQNKQKEKYV
jgi:hypothetical protein